MRETAPEGTAGGGGSSSAPCHSAGLSVSPCPTSLTLTGLLFITAALRPTLLRNSIRFSRQRCFSAITPHARLSHCPYSRPGAPLLSASLNCTQSPQGFRFTKASQCLYVCVCVCVCVYMYMHSHISVHVYTYDMPSSAESFGTYLSEIIEVCTEHLLFTRSYI